MQNQTVRLSEISHFSNVPRSRAESAPYSNLPPPHTQFNSSTNNSIDETNCSKCSNRFSQDPSSIAFPRSASSQYRMPQLNEYFLPDEPAKVPHDLPHIDSPHLSLLSENERTSTPSPTGDSTTLPSFLDRNSTNLKTSHNHLLKPLDTVRPNLTPPPSTSNNNNNKRRERGFSDVTTDPFLVPTSIDFHSSDDNNNNYYKHKGKEIIKGSSSSFTLTPVEVVSTPIENETTNSTVNTSNTNTNCNLINRKSKLKMYSTPPISPERQKKVNTFNEQLLPPPTTTTTATADNNSDKGSVTSSPEYTSRKLTDDDKEDSYVVTTSSLSPAVNKDKRSLQLDSNLIESNLVNDNNSQNHLLVGSPVCSPSRKKQEMKSISSIILDGDDENAKVVTSIDSILDGIPNASESMICHNGTTRNNSDNNNFLE